jgi:hypothetical protein
MLLLLSVRSDADSLVRGCVARIALLTAGMPMHELIVTEVINLRAASHPGHVLDLEAVLDALADLTELAGIYPIPVGLVQALAELKASTKAYRSLPLAFLPTKCVAFDDGGYQLKGMAV